MQRTKTVVTGVLVSLLVAGAFASSAAAQGGGKKGKVPHSDGISGAMGDLEWGMTKQQLMRHFINEVKGKYRKKLAKATGAIEEDRIRHDMNEEIRRIRDSYVEFDGTTTGWDVSFLQDEFTHHNSEAMIVVRDDKAQNFYFLINNRFWKWYRAFNQEVFAGASFDQFAQALQGRFGEAKENQGSIHEGGAEKHWLQWQDNKTHLRAVDNTTFYGFYCLVFEDKSTLSRLDQLRTHRGDDGNNRHSLVDAVTSGEDSSDSDSNQDIVDRITGKIRKRRQAPEDE